MAARVEKSVLVMRELKRESIRIFEFAARAALLCNSRRSSIPDFVDKTFMFLWRPAV
jgi:hypothetical protein